ncbi:TetR family transcriptional regulator C-terminal domain-containing protein [Pseudaminobacter sp. 19-2017]|uniref:TetR family transcriptional regulator C-terminal domain-containing protein n=1 Tax=Pseudaminobacter soli (ex Zhang et al. 2022) TaxID=2831468 RepID=A0A942DZF4_9HYPH|nr:TetR family transcriptional regulator C-terminal domain-containing protein [Pseudaminobacter soli]MBS3650248.1 TetR family transcriptional regulator C-terminal domain-containing protein [Pseudaminobacter soli]
MPSTNQKKPRAHFRRVAPDDRARQLAEATLRCIQKKGSAGISARQIAAEAGVTQGLITHHFGEIGELVAYAFDVMSEGLLEAIMAATEAAPNTPQARLEAYIQASFSQSFFDQEVLRVWVVFWGLILHSPRMSSSQKREYSGFLTSIERLLIDLAANEGFVIADTRLAAIAFNALLDGLWLAWCLNPEAFRPEEGAALCRQWVEGLRRGASAQHQAGS